MRKAFTLIELLVVIAIIGVLAAILFPIFASAKQAAKRTACLSNMKGLGTAFALYLGDSDGVYPACDNDKARITGKPPEPETPEADGPAERDWHVVIQPYLKNYDVLRCPLDDSKRAGDPGEPDLAAGQYVSSYTVNAWAEYDLKESAVTRPSDWILLGERNNVARGPKTWWMFNWWVWQGSGANAVWPPTATPVPTEKAAEDIDFKRDGSNPNWLFGDGHTRNGSLESLWKGGVDNAFWPTPGR